MFFCCRCFSKRMVSAISGSTLRSRNAFDGAVSILLTRRSWRPPSNFAARNASTMRLAISGSVCFEPMQSTLASLCCRAHSGNFVRRDAHAHTARAAEDPKLILAVGDRVAHEVRKVGIVGGFL